MAALRSKADRWSARASSLIADVLVRSKLIATSQFDQAARIIAKAVDARLAVRDLPIQAVRASSHDNQDERGRSELVARQSEAC